MVRRVSEFERSLHEAVSTTTRVGQALYTDTRLRQIRDPLVQLDGSLARVQSGQGATGQFLRDPAQYEKLRADVQDLRRAVAEIRLREFVQSDRQYADWNRTVDAMIQTVDAIKAGSLFGEPVTHDGLNGLLREMRNTVRDFREDPRKYLRLKVF